MKHHVCAVDRQRIQSRKLWQYDRTESTNSNSLSAWCSWIHADPLQSRHSLYGIIISACWAWESTGRGVVRPLRARWFRANKNREHFFWASLYLRKLSILRRNGWQFNNALEGVIDPSIQQPDPARKAICRHYEYCLCYWYADELPRCIALTVVFEVILSILTAPLILLCFVPMIHKMNKVSTVLNTCSGYCVAK